MKKFKIGFPKLKAPRMKLKKKTSTAIPALISILFVLIVTMVIAFIYTATQNRYNSEYLFYLAEQKLLSQRISTVSLEAASGQDAAFVELQTTRDRFQETLTFLLMGNTETGLPSLKKADMAEPLGSLEQAWGEYKYNLDTIITNREMVTTITQHLNKVRGVLPQLKKLSGDVASLLSNIDGIDRQTLYIAGQLPLFVEQLESNLGLILTGGEDAMTASDQLDRDFDRFARYVKALSDGDPILRVKMVESVEAQLKLAEQLNLYDQVQASVAGIVDVSSRFFEIKDSAAQIQFISPEILSADVRLEESINAQAGLNAKIVTVGYGTGAGVLVTAVLLAVLLIGDARKREAMTSDINRRNQEAILRLLDEMTHLAEGDLTTHATVTEDITGAIADSVNFSIDALRSLVETINETVVRVSSSSEQTQSITNRLAKASSQQAREITGTTSSISRMARTMDEVSKSAMNSADVALQSVTIASKGAETVRRNIQAMDDIRDTIQETSKRIKRLGESSQQIGEIVALITDIADRTNILALNAAIQASSAGEAGRGFAVVADEVQRLAERASNATKQISTLVEMIQTDTNEAVSSMEESTSGVVRGAKFAEDAGSALTEIETVSKELADLIQNISNEAREQATVATNISESMNVIQRITVETSEGTRETAVSVGNLTELATELRKSVAGFKLPDSDIDQIQSAANG